MCRCGGDRFRPLDPLDQECNGAGSGVLVFAGGGALEFAHPLAQFGVDILDVLYDSRAGAAVFDPGGGLDADVAVIHKFAHGFALLGCGGGYLGAVGGEAAGKFLLEQVGDGGGVWHDVFFLRNSNRCVPMYFV